MVVFEPGLIRQISVVQTLIHRSIGLADDIKLIMVDEYE